MSHEVVLVPPAPRVSEFKALSLLGIVVEPGYGIKQKNDFIHLWGRECLYLEYVESHDPAFGVRRQSLTSNSTAGLKGFTADEEEEEFLGTTIVSFPLVVVLKKTLKKISDFVRLKTRELAAALGLHYCCCLIPVNISPCRHRRSGTGWRASF